MPSFDTYPNVFQAITDDEVAQQFDQFCAGESAYIQVIQMNDRTVHHLFAPHGTDEGSALIALMLQKTDLVRKGLYAARYESPEGYIEAMTTDSPGNLGENIY